MRSIIAAAAASLGLALAPAASASMNGGACSASATASFTPGLTLASAPFSYTIAGTLANCQAGNAQPASDSPGSGTIFTPEPATGTGGCATRQDGGTLVVAWHDGRTTVISYAVTGVGPVDHLTGYVLASYTVAGGTTSITYTTDEPATPVNDTVEAVLAAQPGGGPTACQSGLKTATLTGAVGFGSPY
jgi:hypothetical protein